MSKISILDCTLREAPIDNLMWGEKAIKRVIWGLEKASIDIIEVGFLKNEKYVRGSTSFQTVNELKTCIQNKKKEIMYVALIDYGRYDIQFLPQYDGTSIDAVRICFKKDEINKVMELAKKIREKGYQVCIQHVDTLGYSDDEIINFLKKINDFKPYSYSIVDTFGAMYETEIIRLADMVNSILDKNIKLGFHGHNNLMLADANAQCFIREMAGKRDIIIDSSMLGCGRGAGNAHTELMIQFMNKNYCKTYDLDEVLDVIDEVISKLQSEIEWGYSMPYFISGMHNAHTFNVKHLLKRHNIKTKDLRCIIELLSDEQKKKYDYSLLEKIYIEYFDKTVKDDTSINIIKENLKNKKVLLLAPGKSVLDSYKEISTFIEKEQPIVIGINNIIDKYKLDYLFYSSAKRYQNMLYQDYIDAGSPQIIFTSNIRKQTMGSELVVDYRSLIKYGWINIDSSAILLLRLMIKCDINQVYIAGLDGYDGFGEFFYKKELDSGIEEKEKIENTRENLEMLEDIKKNHPDFKIHFITKSMYENAEAKYV